jgi:molecular chaperone HtpG
VGVDENDMSPHLQRLLRSAGQEAPAVLPILEINPEHSLIKRIEQASDEQFDDWASLLLDQATLADGAQLSDPVAFVKRMNDLLLKS